VRTWPFPALTLLSALVVLAVLGYHVATTGPRALQGEPAVKLEEELHAPRLVSQGTAGAAQGREDEVEGKANEPSPRFPLLPIERLLDLAVRSETAWTRADALEELASRRSPQAFPVLLDRLADPDGDVRRVAADGLAELGNPSALTALERAFPAEAVAKTRRAMAQAIAELRPSGETHGAE